MEIFNTILIVVGFVFTGWLIKILKAKIENQKDAINTQSKILNDAKAFMDMYDINKLKDFVAIREQTIELQKNKEISEIKAEIDIKNKNERNLALIVKQLNEISDSLIDLSFNLVISVPSNISMEAINKMPDSPIKERFKKISASKEKMEKTPSGLGLRDAHQKIAKFEKFAAGQTPPDDTTNK